MSPVILLCVQGFCYGCPVAIKVIRASGGDNSQLLEGFKEEVKLMSEITHPNVCLFLGGELCLSAFCVVCVARCVCVVCLCGCACALCLRV